MKIHRTVIEQIIQHAKHDAPIEACGYLAEKNGLISLALPLRNVDASAEHFSFDPAEQFSAVRKMRAEGLKLRAVYHSHPASPARPSEEDIRLANDPSLLYFIVSLASDSPDVKAFNIVEGKVTTEPLDILEE